MYPFGDPHQALVEFNTRDALKNALMKNGVEFFKKKLVIKVIDHNKLLQIDARQVPEQHRQNVKNYQYFLLNILKFQQSNAPQYSRDRDRQDRDRDRERQDRQGRNNKGRSDRGQSNRQYDNRSYNNR